MTIFANADARKAFARTVRVETAGEWEGLPTMSHLADADKLAECVGESIGGGLFTKAHLQATLARFRAAGRLAIRASRTGNAISFYEVGGGMGGRDKHIFSPTPRSLRMVIENVESVTKLLSTGGEWYYRHTPSYKYRGKDQPAKDAAVVKLEPGKDPVVIAKGAAADEYAKTHGLTPVNPEGENGDDE